MFSGWKKARGATQEAKAEHFEFSSLVGAEGYICTMDPAVEKPVLIGEYPLEGYEGESSEGGLTMRYKGVWNAATDELANIVSPSYAILQHKNFFGKVIDGLMLADVGEVSGNIIRLPQGNQYRMAVTFHDLVIKEPTRHGGHINPGAIFMNSYDKSSSARGMGYFYRKVCKNGMVFQHLIPGADFSRNHVARDEATLLDRMETQVFEFVRTIATSEGIVGEAIELSSTRELDFERHDNIIPTIQGLVGAVKHAEGIYEILDIKDTGTTYWDLYNAFTDYASHSGISLGVQDRLQSVAEQQILSSKATNIRIIEPEAVEVAMV